MRRGLMAWDAEELPPAALAARIGRLRARMRDHDLDAFVIYTNIARGAAVCWSTGFTPYWNEGLLLVPREGEPLFATALSKRVAEWIGSVMPLGTVVTTPRPAALVAERLAQTGARRAGVLELDDFPAGHAAALLDGSPGLGLVEGTLAFREARAVADAPERLLMRRADALARSSLEDVGAGADLPPVLDIVARCERQARLGGAEECFVTLAASLAKPGGFLRCDRLEDVGPTFAVRVSVAYKGVWSRYVRSLASDPDALAAFAAADDALGALRLAPGASLADEIERAFAGVAAVRQWTAEQMRGSYPLAAVAGSAGAGDGFEPANPFVLSVEAQAGGMSWRGARLIEPAG